MTCVSSGFRSTLLFLMLFVASQSLAKPGNNANSTPVSSTATKHCNNVYNSFYAGPNKKIETFLQEMKTQLTRVEDDINILKSNKTSEKGKNRSDDVLRLSSRQRGSVQSDFLNDLSRRLTLWSISQICNPLCLDYKLHHQQSQT